MQLGQIASRPEAQVHAIKDRPPAERSQQQANRSRFGGEEQPNCHNCGRRHKKGQCSAAGVTCYSCGKLGHYSKRCSNQEDHQQRHSRNDRQGGTTAETKFWTTSAVSSPTGNVHATKDTHHGRGREYVDT